ncbi:MAG TPA: peptide chain release factor N(5)-glutamine methyltransferase [Candidatus Sulfotelmatobacter sp.]|nr:peptide chain release factor N(5)-glutamine methyltransferase [Candidatus Sulfotelmatobacter sp.]
MHDGAGSPTAASPHQPAGVSVPAPGRTLLDILRLSTDYLARHGSSSPRLDAELLLAQVLGLRRIDLYLQFDRPLRDEELADARELVRRRGTGEPVAYLTGRREFYGREFRVSRDVLIPRPETETLVERALMWARRVAGEERTGLRIADLGTGSGCIACTLAAELPGAVVVGTDASSAALEVAAANAARLGLHERVRLVLRDWTAPPDDVDERFDMIVSNPPYVTTGELEELARDVRCFEPPSALDGGEDGLSAYRGLLPFAAGAMATPGYLAVEVDPRRAAAVAALIASALPDSDPVVVSDLAGQPRVVEVAVRSGPWRRERVASD